ncbi:bacteriohemerythrin [Reinekea sp.]|jgi:hemerythrin|uniref:bacteriohemerythrin n=1 Tax=Reinekea sp. TaxID=1970455 RepID=UPI00398A392C
MKLQWSSEYELGIQVIDNQHERIVDYINDVDELQSTHSNRGELEQVLHRLVDYTQSHFAFEEALLEEVGYPELLEHQATHQAFISEIEQMHRDFKEGHDIANELAEFLLKWLLEHIRSDDLSYSALVKETLLKQGAQTHSSWTKRAIEKYFKKN